MASGVRTVIDVFTGFGYATSTPYLPALTELLVYVKFLRMAPLQVTVAVATVLRAFLDDPTQPRYGYELMKLTGFPSGKLYPILARLQRAGWLIREHEEVDPAAAGRPARRFYRLTPDGVRAARGELAALGERLRLAPGPGGTLRPEGGYA